MSNFAVRHIEHIRQSDCAAASQSFRSVSQPFSKLTLSTPSNYSQDVEPCRRLTGTIHRRICRYQHESVQTVMIVDRKRLARIPDCAAVLVAAALPWSTSATSILLAVWLVTVIPTLDFTAIWREVKSFAGGLPVLLWLLAVVGMLWADVSWVERFAGLSSFHRLLVIPVLLAQFRRSQNGSWVLHGFSISTVMLMLASWILALTGLPWHNANNIVGVPVHDMIAQSTLFLIYAFALFWRACDLLQGRNWPMAMAIAGLAALFIANLVFVATSRTDIVVFPLLAVLFGWRRFGLSGVIVGCVAASVLLVAAWMSSPYLRARVHNALEDVANYRSTHADSDVGEHIEFLKKSIAFIREAPVIGHGTGSIPELFRRSVSGQTGVAAVTSVNPHNQILAVAVQLGLVGATVLLAMWAAHYFLFRGTNLI
ncbi:MAG: O-antigen ligase family protein, partial [Xanthobacteraceae bacterium]